MIVIAAFVVTPAPDHPSVMLGNICSDMPVPYVPISTSCAGLLPLLEAREKAYTSLPQAPMPNRSPKPVPLPKSCLSSEVLGMLLVYAVFSAAMSISASESLVVLHDELQLRIVASPSVAPLFEKNTTSPDSSQLPPK